MLGFIIPEPCRIISCHVVPFHDTSGRVPPCHVTSSHVMSCPVMTCHVMSCHVMSCHVMSRHVVTHHVMSCHVMSCHVMSCYVMFRHIPARRVVSLHVMSCHVWTCLCTPCRAPSCPVMPSRVKVNHEDEKTRTCCRSNDVPLSETQYSQRPCQRCQDHQSCSTSRRSKFFVSATITVKVKFTSRHFRFVPKVSMDPYGYRMELGLSPAPGQTWTPNRTLEALVVRVSEQFLCWELSSPGSR